VSCKKLKIVKKNFGGFSSNLAFTIAAVKNEFSTLHLIKQPLINECMITFCLLGAYVCGKE
jgi:hypothetical protein